jgi:hypothetical protein
MPDTNYNPGGSKDQSDELDRILDASLAKYAAVEPRAGLEERVLAHLSVESLQTSSHAWLQWGLAGALAVIVLVAVLAWRSTRIPHPVVANHPSITIQRPSIQELEPAPPATGDVAAAKLPSMRKPAARRAPASTGVANPKLEQFPSPQPLSAEEMALTHYVKDFPKEARLVAQTQEEFALETQKEMNDAGSQNRPPIQPER